MRIRSRSISGRYRHGTSSSWGSWQNYSSTYEYIAEDPVPGGNRVFHSKATPQTGIVYPHICAPPTYPAYRQENEDVAPNAPILVPHGLQIPMLPLNHSKLPTSSEFGLIQFFAELDDTLAMFSKKFIDNLSYGAVNWGIMPFVNDVQNLMSMLRNLNSDLTSIPYEDTLSGEIDIPVPCGASGTAYKCHFELRLSGTANISFADDILILYDRLGFHLDLETVWDLVPLSFVVDWFLPVGDLIDRLHDRGWVTSALFTGWRSAKIHYLTRAVAAYGAVPDYPIDIYLRDYLSSSLITAYEAPKPIQIKRPSFKQLFNTLYIAKLNKFF